MVRKIGKTAKYVYEGGCIGDEICKLLELAAVVELESWRARASTKSGQRPTPNIGLFGFCWILKIRRVPVLGLEFEAESQKCMYMVKLFVHIEVELTLFQTNTNSFTTYVVKLFVHIEVELTLFQTNTISLTLYVVTSPLSL